ncbi:hypothetical protein BC829DRAFT_298899 [Chytridium lagenaria]|nr:hypothetical protein BC829DRAFT_298899 [Chytridium lagenaria]
MLKVRHLAAVYLSSTRNRNSFPKKNNNLNPLNVSTNSSRKFGQSSHKYVNTSTTKPQNSPPKTRLRLGKIRFIHLHQAKKETQPKDTNPHTRHSPNPFTAIQKTLKTHKDANQKTPLPIPNPNLLYPKHQRLRLRHTTTPKKPPKKPVDSQKESP